MIVLAFCEQNMQNTQFREHIFLVGFGFNYNFSVNVITVTGLQISANVSILAPMYCTLTVLAAMLTRQEQN